MTDVVKPTSGSPTETDIDQAHMVVPAVAETPDTSEENARQGGTIFTKSFDSSETRPQELHGAVNYQKETSTDGVPAFIPYTDLTMPKGTVRG